ncbi:MAG TPA: hypothetical protein VF168_14530 [Trueperaceae bacterium]
MPRPDNPFDFPLHRTRLACMHDIIQRVARGYHYHHTGKIHVGKAARLVEHLDRKHGVLAGENERSLLKRRGHPAAVVLLDYDRGLKSQELDFVLLATSKLSGENLRDARFDGLVWRGIYKLHPKQRIGKREAEEFLRGRKRLTWTWSLTAEAYQQWEAGLTLKASWRSADALNATLNALDNVPGFAGVRSQKKRLIRTAKASWARSHRSSQSVPPNWPEQVTWVRKVAYYDNPPLTLYRLNRCLLGTANATSKSGSALGQPEAKD